MPGGGCKIVVFELASPLSRGIDSVHPNIRTRSKIVVPKHRTCSSESHRSNARCRGWNVRFSLNLSATPLFILCSSTPRTPRESWSNGFDRQNGRFIIGQQVSEASYEENQHALVQYKSPSWPTSAPSASLASCSRGESPRQYSK